MRLQITRGIFAIIVSAYAGQYIAPLGAESEKPLPKCMAQWYVDSHTTKEEWLRACQQADAADPNYNVDYARCLADWDPTTHMTKREWHRSCANVVKEDPGAFVAAPRNR
jgi:hypothetical protein